MNQLHKTILDYLQSRDGNWKWFLGAKCYTKKETIKLFKEDESFREMIVKEVLHLATDLFVKGAEPS